MGTKKSKKIIFFTRELNNVMGGLEKQMLSIAKSLVGLGHHVTVISLDEMIPKAFFSHLATGVEFRNISSGSPSQRQNLYRRIYRQFLVYKVIKSMKFDVGVSFMTGAYWYSRIPTYLCGVPLVLAERNAPSIYRLTRVRKYRNLLFISMGFSSAITVQFARYADSYPFFLQNKIQVIPNAVEPIIIKKVNKQEKITYVFAGRFSYQKQPILLLKAFLVFSQQKKDVQLLMYGVGELKEELERIIITSKSSDFIKILEPTYYAEDFLEKAQVLCIPSIWEGFPNVLAEALSAGVPAIGFSNCDGVTDLIENGINGWKIEGNGMPDSLTNLLELSYKDIKESKINYDNCKKSVEHYKSDIIAKEWEKLIFTLV